MTALNKNEFKMRVSNRINQLGGGIVIITKSHLGQCKLDKGKKQSFQYAIWKISTKHDTITVVVIYHPLYSTQQPITNAIFLDEITKWLADVLTNHNNILLAGDFNLHVNDENDTDASIFIDTIEVMGLQQYVIYPTHKTANNILDLVFTELITQIQIDDLSCSTFLSDHCTVDFITTIPRDEPKTKIITYRKVKNINPEEMMKDIDAMQDMIQDEDLTDKINSFESVLKDALDKHAPAITKT